MKTFEIEIVPQGQSTAHKIIIEARSSDEAKNLVKMQYGNCSIRYMRQVS